MKEAVGTWDAIVKSQGMEEKGTSVVKMTLGGLWQVEDFKCNFGGMVYQGHGMTTYDPAKKKYVSAWFDSWSTTPMLSEGTYDPEKKVLMMTGTATSPTGEKAIVKMKTEQKDRNSRIFTMTMVSPDGKELETMMIVYKRKQ